MPQNRWRHWGSLQRSPDSLAGFKGKVPPGKGRGKGWEREREEGIRVGEKDGEKGELLHGLRGDRRPGFYERMRSKYLANNLYYIARN